MASLAAPPPLDPAYCAENNANEILGITGAMVAMAVVTCVARILARIFMIKSVGADDHIMVVATLLAIGTFVCFVGEINDAHSSGRHVACIATSNLEKFGRWQFVHSIIVMWGVVLVKISIALFLLRLVPPGKKWKYSLWASIIFLIAFMMACSGTLIFQCIPIHAAWDFAARPTAKCFSKDAFSAIGLTNSCINVVTDFLFALLPVPIIVQLQVSFRTKITLCFILSLGYVACAAGIVKAVKQATFFSNPDPLWHNAFNVWNMIELCVGIVSASLPALRPIFSHLLASTKTVFTSGSRIPNHQPPNHRSSAYLRRSEKSQDMQLSDMQTLTGSSGTGVKRSVDEDILFPTDSKRYTVDVSAAQDSASDSWDDLHCAPRSPDARSPPPTHTFHQPSDSRIVKTTEITRRIDVTDATTYMRPGVRM